MSIEIKLRALNPLNDSIVPYGPILDKYFARFNENLACDFTKEELIDNYFSLKMVVWLIYLNDEIQAIGFTDRSDNGHTLFLRGLSGRIGPRDDGAVYKINDWIALVIEELKTFCHRVGIKNMVVSARSGLLKTYNEVGFKEVSTIMLLRL